MAPIKETQNQDLLCQALTVDQRDILRQAISDELATLRKFVSQNPTNRAPVSPEWHNIFELETIQTRLACRTDEWFDRSMNEFIQRKKMRDT